MAPTPPAASNGSRIATWVLDSLSSGIIAIDAKGAVATFNRSAQRILGCPAGDFRASRGRDCREVLAAQPAVARLLIDSLATHSALGRAELVLNGVSGRPPIAVGLTLSPIRDPAGAIVGSAMVFRDLTALEGAGEQQQLRDRLAALGEMAAGLAHEIRNPLASMEVIAGLLERRLRDRPEETAMLVELRQELKGLADTVTDCLDFVRPVVLARDPVKPVELMESALATARSRIAFAGTIEREYIEPLDEFIGDRAQLRAVLVNLIVNAFESMAGATKSGMQLSLGLYSRAADRSGEAIRIRSDGRADARDEMATRELVMTVADTGPGVAVEIGEKIFYPFFTTKQRGSGVGLALAQKIVGGHGGRLCLDTRDSGGCQFRVHVPIGAGESDSAERCSEANP
ncbi:MAG: ATP-binding protein [Myxococcota bacterium]